MKQRLLTVISFFLFVIAGTNINAQKDLPSFPSLEDNPVWSIQEASLRGDDYWKIKYEYDTVLCGQQFIKVGSKDKGISAYLRVDGQQVYLRKNSNCSESECLIYDFSLEVGDTINGCRGLYWVTAVDSITKFGVTRKRLQVKEKYLSHHWIEGIGSSYHLLYPLICVPASVCETFYFMLCLHVNGVQIYEHPAIESFPRATCNGVVNLNGMEMEVGILVYPNPARENIFLTIDNTLENSIRTMEIYSLSGTRIRNYPATMREINISDFTGGHYFLIIQTDEGEIYRKKLMIK